MDHFEELPEAGDRLKNAGGKSHLVEDYIMILKLMKNNEKEKLLAVTMIPKFFKYFLAHWDKSMSTRFVYKLLVAVNFLMEILTFEIDSGDVYKALLLLESKIPKFLTILFEHIWSPSKTVIHEKEEMEMHVTDLIKRCLEVVADESEFVIYMDFLKSLSIFEYESSQGHMNELIGLIEGHANFDEPFKVLKVDKFLSFMYMAFPFFLRGASSIKFVEYLNKNIFPVFDQLLEEQKFCLLQSVAYISPYTSWESHEMILPSIVLLLEKCMPLRKADGEQMDFTYVECLLYAYHHIVYNVSTNHQMSQTLTDRLDTVKHLTKTTMKGKEAAKHKKARQLLNLMKQGMTLCGITF
ncbi:hypothetical protein EZV62_025284 [Acer yangbiense]|uniref:Uncharacterized protein n=1 Tax=Acer yangbiense TaxID=1000413 RepID=A0A5C7GY07_9ROSI|nr:hypothetical protein EZV62_025284 [Acer yangbiense]